MSQTLSRSIAPSSSAEPEHNPNSGVASNFALEAGIELIGEVDGSVGGVFPSLLSVYEHQGYRQGYNRAVQDLLASLVSATESFIHRQNVSADAPSVGAAELRRLLHQFGLHLERQIQAMASQDGYVSDGLGI